MRRHPRIRKALKWMSASLLALLLASWLYSMAGWLYYVSDQYIVGIVAGRLDLTRITGDLRNELATCSPVAFDSTDLARPVELARRESKGLTVGGLREHRPFDELFGAVLPGYHQFHHPGHRQISGVVAGPATTDSVVIPFWLLGVAGLLFTVWCAWLDRPALPGQCRTCRYDFRGSCAWRCPECGTPVPEWLAANPPPPRKLKRRNKPVRIATGVAILLLLCLYWASTTWSLSCNSKYYWVSVNFGALRAMSIVDADPADRTFHQGFNKTGWSVRRIPRSPHFMHAPKYGHEVIKGTQIRYVTIPLWMPLLALLLFAALLVYRDRTRRFPGFCHKCGYNLTGNASGRCPECGSSVPMPEAAT
jgi:predicted Zn-ribbon and HTH transcriptional regulator